MERLTLPLRNPNRVPVTRVALLLGLLNLVSLGRPTGEVWNERKVARTKTNIFLDLLFFFMGGEMRDMGALETTCAFVF